MRIVLFAVLVLAQTAVCQESPFEVASVRANRKLRCLGRWDFTAARGSVTAENAPLRRIISRAYNLTDDRVSGPGWIDSECYDIKAKAAAGTQDRELMPMLQTLLRERFHLVARLESDERPVYVLTVDQGGPKFGPYGEHVNTPPTEEGKVLFMVRHMRDLSERLGRVSGRPVIDKTGLDGDYLIVLSYPALDPAAADPSGDIFEAVRSQLGLKLEPQRGMVESLKIQSLSKMPTEN
jgi:uncharacterized protein (TIGR03435 family)